MSDTGTIRIAMSAKLVVLREKLEASLSRPDASTQRDADTIARLILRAQSGSRRLTIAEIVQHAKNNPVGGGERQGDFDYTAWTRLAEKVVAALQSDTPAKSLERVR